MMQAIDKTPEYKGIQLDYNGHTEYTPYHGKSFVFLRDPTAHSLSIFTYIKTHRWHHQHDLVKDITFSQYLERVIDHESTNARDKSFVSFFGPNLEAAKTILTDITFIGFTEQFEADLQRFLAFLGVQWKPTGKKQNAAKGCFTHTESDLAFIRKCRADDYELIEYAKSLNTVSRC
jgi:hypothetical protein